MKKLIISIAVIALLCLTSCTLPEGRQVVLMKGNPYYIDENNSLIIGESTISEHSITVEVNAAFVDFSLKDFYRISMHKSETGQPYIDVDKTATDSINGYDVFSKPINKSFYLVFTDDSINEDIDISTYNIWLMIVSDDGIAHQMGMSLI